MTALPNSAVNPQPPRMVVQAFWLTLSKLIAALLNIALPILLVRLMSQRDFGVYKQAFLFAMTATNMANLGVGVSAFYYMPRHPERGGQIALNILIYNAVAGLIPLFVLMAFPRLLTMLFRTNALEPMAWLLGLLVLVTLSASLVQIMPTALQDVRYSTILIVGTQFVRAVLLVIAAVWYHTVVSLIWATILSQVVSLAVLFWYLRDKFGHFWTHFDRHFFIEQLTYAFPIGAFALLWVVQKDLDNYFVSGTLGPKDYAIYAVGWIDVPLVSLFQESVGAVLVLRISALQHQGNIREIRRVMAAAWTRLASFQFPACMLLLVAGHDLIVLLYTHAYEASTQIFRVSILLLALNVFLMDPVTRSYKEVRFYLLIIRILIFTALVCSLTTIIHHYGMIGAAIAAVGAQYVEKIIFARKVATKVGATLQDLPLFSHLFKISAITLVAGLAAYLARNLVSPPLLIVRIATVTLVLGAVYLTGFYLLRIPGWEFLSWRRITAAIRSRLAGLRPARG
ncbi:MAG TPA: oligosaccharide flippase family protein [Candidatus Angelobacter sp.]|nr:oligosaccharide flippase family protein [Candidatus Angelobacter sp.]